MQADRPVPLLLFHGLLSTPQEFGLIAHALRREGIVHEAVSVPGYTMAGLAGSHDWTRWLKAAQTEVERRIAPGEAVILGGLCMGGVLAAALALQGRYRVAGLVLMSPTFTYDGWGLSPWRHLRRLGYWLRVDRFISVSEREPYGIKNLKIRKWVQREMSEKAGSAAGPARLPLRALREGERMMAWVGERIAALDCPTMVIHAREDEITSLPSVEKLFGQVQAPDKRLVVLDNSYHMITIDNDRQRVVEELGRFVAARTAAQEPESGPDGLASPRTRERQIELGSDFGSDRAPAAATR